MTKLLFLDIDGVLNSERSVKHNHRKGISGEAIMAPHIFHTKPLGRILNAVPDLEIVISSTWRILFSLAEIQRAILDSGMCVKNRIRIRGKTPRHKTGYRGTEIKMYLDNIDENDVHIAILDDDSDMDPFKDHFFKTSSEQGLTEEIADAVIAHLNQ